MFPFNIFIKRLIYKYVTLKETMTKPIMLITGTSRGIGLACAEYFQDRYEIVGISRTSGKFVTEQGSVSDPLFRKHIIEKYTPDVFINNAGIGGSDVSEIIRVNAEASTDFMVGFYKKMKNGHIINMSSYLATVSGVKLPGISDIVYASTKKLIKELSKEFSHMRYKIKVTSIEPGWVDTAMVTFASKPFNKIIEPKYIAETIDWIIHQPSWVNIDSICISNFHSENIE